VKNKKVTGEKKKKRVENKQADYGNMCHDSVSRGEANA